LKPVADQSFLAPFVKALAGIAAIARSRGGFLTAVPEKPQRSRGRGLRNRMIYGLSCVQVDFFARSKMSRAFAWLLAAMTLLAVDPARAQGFNFGNFFSSSAIPRELVSFSGRYSSGTIVISTAERRLYLVLPNGQALKYGIGVGRDGFSWSGSHRITAKKEWPGWTPPSEMLARRPDLPRYLPGGIQNPLGARAMYLGSTLYRIHGSNEPETIGHAVSSGCIRMTNEDVTDLYNRVGVGTMVVVRN
jgi:lipoprotein-anchoring transpeptidase ErfK/SrfK